MYFQILKACETKVIWWLYWIGLGVLSSVGLGTGLHTFVLYLGPHIAAVTMAAYECGALNFPEPPYPDQIICPTTIDPMWTAGILNIMRKVRIEAMLWGAGTALGELPPYFMARAARTSGQNNKNENFDQEDLRELEALEASENGENVSLLIRIKLSMKHFVQKAGFWGILACASVSKSTFEVLFLSTYDVITLILMSIHRYPGDLLHIFTLKYFIFSAKNFHIRQDHPAISLFGIFLIDLHFQFDTLLPENY